MISANTPAEILKAFQELGNQGATKFVLDLRDNGGGLLDAGIDTARLFLKDGTIIEQRYRDKEVETYRVDKAGRARRSPAGGADQREYSQCGRDHRRSITSQPSRQLIGSPSYGKDTIQLVFDLKDGSSLHVTTAHWWVPGLEPPIAENGLQPDILIASARTIQAALTQPSRQQSTELFESWMNHEID